MRHCLHPGCPALVDKGRCDAHGGQRAPWQAKPAAPVRLRGRANQARRRRLFAREPLCRSCVASGRVTMATIADHIVPLAEGGADTEANLQPLCASCHDAKTRKESVRANPTARRGE